MSGVDPDDGLHLDLAAPVGSLREQVGELADRLGVAVPTLLGGIAAVALGSVVVLWLVSRSPAAPVEVTIPRAVSTPTVSPSTSEEPRRSVVHAAGAVAHPGVYVLDSGARVSDLLAAAGGPRADADLDRVNLAAPLVDGARVYVPAVGEDQLPSVEVGGASLDPSEADPGQRVDLNRASAAELQHLPGVGPATAEAIVEHRERNGPFRYVEDLMAVRGIGEAKLAALRDRVHV